MSRERENTKCGGGSIWAQWISLCGKTNGSHIADHFFGGGSVAFDIFNDLLQHATRRMIRHTIGDLDHWCTTGEGVIGDLILEKGVYVRVASSMREMGQICYRDYHRDTEDQSAKNIRKLRMQNEVVPRNKGEL